MQRFSTVFNQPTGNVIGMIHVGALPGTPKNTQSVKQILDAALREAHIYAKAGVV